MENQELKKKQPFNSYIKYSGVAIQMIATLFIFGFAGYKLDQYFELDRPLITLGSLLIGTGVAIFLVIRQLKES